MFLLLFVAVFSLSRFDVESGPGNFFDEFFYKAGIILCPVWKTHKRKKRNFSLETRASITCRAARSRCEGLCGGI